MNIRELRADDLAPLLGRYTHLHEHDDPRPSAPEVQAVWAEALANPRIQYFGGWDGVQLISSCMLTIIPNLTRACRPFGVIENLVTQSAYRGRGWGRALLRHALAHAWQARCCKVMLMTGRKDEKTLRFYEQSGFERHGKQAFVARPPQ